MKHIKPRKPKSVVSLDQVVSKIPGPVRLVRLSPGKRSAQYWIIDKRGRSWKVVIQGPDVLHLEMEPSPGKGYPQTFRKFDDIAMAITELFRTRQPAREMPRTSSKTVPGQVPDAPSRAAAPPRMIQAAIRCQSSSLRGLSAEELEHFLIDAVVNVLATMPQRTNSECPIERWRVVTLGAAGWLVPPSAAANRLNLPPIAVALGKQFPVATWSVEQALPAQTALTEVPDPPQSLWSARINSVQWPRWRGNIGDAVVAAWIDGALPTPTYRQKWCAAIQTGHVLSPQDLSRLKRAAGSVSAINAPVLVALLEELETEQEDDEVRTAIQGWRYQLRDLARRGTSRLTPTDWIDCLREIHADSLRRPAILQRLAQNDLAVFAYHVPAHQTATAMEHFLLRVERGGADAVRLAMSSHDPRDAEAWWPKPRQSMLQKAAVLPSDSFHLTPADYQDYVRKGLQWERALKTERWAAFPDVQYRIAIDEPHLKRAGIQQLAFLRQRQNNQPCVLFFSSRPVGVFAVPFVDDQIDKRLRSGGYVGSPADLLLDVVMTAAMYALCVKREFPAAPPDGAGAAARNVALDKASTLGARNDSRFVVNLSQSGRHKRQPGANSEVAVARHVVRAHLRILGEDETAGEDRKRLAWEEGHVTLREGYTWVTSHHRGEDYGRIRPVKISGTTHEFIGILG